MSENEGFADKRRGLTENEKAEMLAFLDAEAAWFAQNTVTTRKGD